MFTDKGEGLGRFGSYELLVELASGGMATVYLARAADGRDSPLVAIKKPHRHIARDKSYLTMLVDEARLASAIRHDNVVLVRELGFQGGEPFIVMNYVEGASLADIRRELSEMRRALDPRFAVKIALDTLAGLHAAHILHDENGKHLGIIHRDVSPHNILLGCDGVCRLTDFGIAKAADRVQTTKTHEVKGKLAYLAPERIDKRRICTTQSDIFSMGVVLWECIAGRRLFRGEQPVETLQEVMTAPIPSLRRIGVPISEALDSVILRALDRDLATRYKTADEFSAALLAAAGPENVAKLAEIASLVEALFGDRLRIRHEGIRNALGSVDIVHVLEVSGLHARPAPTEAMRARHRMAIETIAPPAPSERYTFNIGDTTPRTFTAPRIRAALIGLVAALSISVLAIAVARRKERDKASKPPIVNTELAFRHVVVPLPFVATRVTFDEQVRENMAPSNVVAFEVPRESGFRHRVTAASADGAITEAYVKEADGVARPEEGDFVVESLETYDEEADAGADASRPSSPRRIRRRPKDRHATPMRPSPPASVSPSKPLTTEPVGSVKDGFTKLK